MERKTVIITGGGQGIGKVTALELAKKGHQVVILEIDQEAGAETVAESEGNIFFIPCDVAEEDQVRSAVEQVQSEFGRLDAIVNNAAIGANGPVEELSLADWNRVLAVNLTAPFLLARYGAPHLRKAKGSIVNLCSTRAHMSEPDTEAYSASKGGIYALTHALAMSLGPDVRVNSISPGWIDVTRHQKQSRLDPYDFRPEDHRQHPAGRVGTPYDISNLIAYLISPEAGFITGQDFVVDGGMTRKMIYV